MTKVRTLAETAKRSVERRIDTCRIGRAFPSSLKEDQETVLAKHPLLHITFQHRSGRLPVGTTGVALAAGYSYLAERSMALRWLLILAMVPLAIISNGTRVMITALMANYIRPQAAEVFVHEFSGWVIFVFATILFLGLHASLTVVWRKLRALA